MSAKLKIISFNAEGMSLPKSDILSNLKADVLCIQETHKLDNPPKIPGMHLAISHQSAVHGSAIYVRDKSMLNGCNDFTSRGIEILQVKTIHLTITSVYKPPPVPFSWPDNIQIDNNANIIIGDFNSHNRMWGYDKNNQDGDCVEEWALHQNLAILNRPKDKPSFLSARWRKDYNPDLAFSSARHRHNFSKTTGQPIPKSQHRPIIVEMQPVVGPVPTKPMPRFNYRRANWEGFTDNLENAINDVPPVASGYEAFQALVWHSAKKNIPRGCRREYITGLDETSKTIYENYVQAYNRDPFEELTIELGNKLLASLSAARKERWMETVADLDMTHNSKNAWKTIKTLNSDKKTDTTAAAVTPNQVAHQLLINGKPLHRERGYLKQMKEKMGQVHKESDDMFLPFTEEELKTGIKHLKSGKASGLDGISTEMILHFGPRSRKWILSLFNSCAVGYNIPKIWRRAKVIALLKPGKDPKLPSSYRPISLLCVQYKLYERLILARISPIVEDQLTDDQAGFREGRSCVGQVLNLTQYIEDGYERKKSQVLYLSTSRQPMTPSTTEHFC